MSWREDDTPPSGAAGFGARLRRGLADPTNLAVPPVIAIFCLIRSWNLIADIPYWVIGVLVITALVVNSVNAALWGDGAIGWRLHARVGVEMAVIALVIYGIGWGAILAIGFVFGAVDVMRRAQRVARSAMRSTILLGSARSSALMSRSFAAEAARARDQRFTWIVKPQMRFRPGWSRATSLSDTGR